MSLLLDTDVLVNLERGRLPEGFLERVVGSGEVFISAVTVSELLVGVYRASSRERRTRRLALIESLLARVAVLDFTALVARLHAELSADLIGRGERIGAHDLMIAATALSHGYPVLTSNVREFRRVSGLSVLEFELGEQA